MKWLCCCCSCCYPTLYTHKLIELEMIWPKTNKMENNFNCNYGKLVVERTERTTSPPLHTLKSSTQSLVINTIIGYNDATMFTMAKLKWASKFREWREKSIKGYVTIHSLPPTLHSTTPKPYKMRPLLIIKYLHTQTQMFN